MVVPFQPVVDESTASDPAGEEPTTAALPTSPPDDNALSKVVLRANPTLFLWLFR
jgi:hypothetical protein